jgi:hypothetical protein
MREIDLKATEQKIIIDPAGDLVLRLYKKNKDFSFEGAGAGKNIIEGKVFAQLMNDWFKKWFAQIVPDLPIGKPVEINDLELLVYPCRQFDYAAGFAAVTKKLAFQKAGHISIWNPHHRTRQLQIAPRIVGKVLKHRWILN